MGLNGRIVIPIEIRQQYDIDENGTSVEIICRDDGLLIRKYGDACIICGKQGDIEIADGKKVCINCLEQIRK